MRDRPAAADAGPARRDERGRASATRPRLAASLLRFARIVVEALSVFVPVFVIGTFLTFLLRYISGLNPVYFILGDSASPDEVARLEAQLGLDRPFWEQYGSWVGDLLSGSLGTSWYNGVDIFDTLLSRAGVSLSIAAVALVIGVVVGVAAGTVAALRRGSLVDRGVTFVVTATSVIPNFVIAIILIVVVAVGLRLLPAAGYVPLNRGFSPWSATILLPAIVLSVDTVADIARQLRAGLVSSLDSSYVLGARLLGLSERRIFWAHGVRNGVAPALAVLGLRLPGLLGGAVITEAIFAIPGMGKFASDSALRGDVPAVQGVMVYSIVLIVVFNFGVNVLLNRLSPGSGRGR